MEPDQHLAVVVLQVEPGQHLAVVVLQVEPEQHLAVVVLQVEPEHHLAVGVELVVLDLQMEGVDRGFVSWISSAVFLLGALEQD